MIEKIVTLISLTSYVHYATAFVKDGGSRPFDFKIKISWDEILKNFKRKTSFEQSGDLVPYPIEVDPDWDKETQIEFIKRFENEKEISCWRKQLCLKTRFQVPTLISFITN